MKRFDDLLDLVKNISHVEPEAQMVYAAVAVAFNLQRGEIGSPLEQLRTGDHDNNAHRTRCRLVTTDSLIQKFSEECAVVLTALQCFRPEPRALCLLQRFHQ